MPYREYLCNYCGHQWDELVYSTDPKEYRTAECRCGSKGELLPSIIGGMQGSFGTPRRKNSTAMGSKKAFTGHPGNEGEPENEQLELELKDKEGNK